MYATETTSKGYVLGPDEGDAQWYLGHLFDWKAVGEQTNGLFAWVDILARKGEEPPIHVHTREDEVFYVLEGEMTFKVGDELSDAKAGSFVYAPRNLPHGFALRTETARFIVVFTPAGGEKPFFALSEPAAGRRLPETVPTFDPAEVEALDAKAGVTFVGPPLPVLLAAQ